MSALSSATSTALARSPSSAGPASRHGSSSSHRTASVTKGSADRTRPGSAAAGASCSAGRCAEPNGSRTVNVLPSPSRDAAEIVPPCSATSSRASASPMPEPSAERPRAPRTWWNRSNSSSRSAAGMPMPVSATSSTAVVAVAAQPDGDAAVEGELERVGQQVEDDLLPALPVDPHRLVQRRRRTVNARPARSTADRNMPASSAVSALRSVGANRACIRPACSREKSSRVFTSLPSRSPLRWATSSSAATSGGGQHGGMGAQLLDRALHQGERRAELVADAGEELRLRPVQLRERLRAAAFGFVGAGRCRARSRSGRRAPRRSRGSARRRGGTG